MGYYAIASSPELYHHGVLGMKWGIRRYQPYSIGYDAEHKGRFVGLTKEHKAAKAKAKETYKANKQIIKEQRAAGLSRAGLNPLKRNMVKADAEKANIENKAEYYKAIGNERKERRQYINAMKRTTFAQNPLQLPKAWKNSTTKAYLKTDLDKKYGKDYTKKVIRRAVAETIGGALAAVAVRELGKKWLVNYVAVKENNAYIDTLGLNSVDTPKGQKFTSGFAAAERGKKIFDQILGYSAEWEAKHRYGRRD